MLRLNHLDADSIDSIVGAAARLASVFDSGSVLELVLVQMQLLAWLASSAQSSVSVSMVALTESSLLEHRDERIQLELAHCVAPLHADRCSAVLRVALMHH